MLLTSDYGSESSYPALFRRLIRGVRAHEEFSLITRYLFLIFSITCLAGCTGGTIGGLFPAPKLLQGSIDGDYYISRDGIFKVQLPHPPSMSGSESYEWSYTKVNEIYQLNESGDRAVLGAVFGPAAFDLNLYHAVLVQAEMQEPKSQYVKDVFSRKVGEREGYLGDVHYEEFILNGNRVYYSVYQGSSQYLVLSLTDAGKSFYAVEADINFNSQNIPSLSTLKSRSWEKFNSMLESFVILKPLD